jgi:hypothetical protein
VLPVDAEVSGELANATALEDFSSRRAARSTRLLCAVTDSLPTPRACKLVANDRVEAEAGADLAVAPGVDEQRKRPGSDVVTAVHTHDGGGREVPTGRRSNTVVSHSRGRSGEPEPQAR